MGASSGDCCQSRFLFQSAEPLTVAGSYTVTAEYTEARPDLARALPKQAACIRSRAGGLSGCCMHHSAWGRALVRLHALRSVGPSMAAAEQGSLLVWQTVCPPDTLRAGMPHVSDTLGAVQVGCRSCMVAACPEWACRVGAAMLYSTAHDC